MKNELTKRIKTYLRGRVSQQRKDQSGVKYGAQYKKEFGAE